MLKKSESLYNINLLYCVQKINEEIVTFGDKEIEKRKFHYRKKPILFK